MSKTDVATVELGNVKLEITQDRADLVANALQGLSLPQALFLLASCYVDTAYFNGVPEGAIKGLINVFYEQVSTAKEHKFLKSKVIVHDPSRTS